jgi:hypothetical protein
VDYDGKDISTIEREAFGANKAHATAHETFIGILFYLQHTKRYRENKAYKERPFTEYVKNVFGISFQTYEYHRFAYFQHPKETRTFGPEVIRKIAAKCGREMVGKVISEVEEGKNSIKKADPETIQKAIDKYAKPKLKARKDRPSYRDLERELVAEKKKNTELTMALKERDEQIERLKKTINEYRSRYEQISRIMPTDFDNQRPCMRQ